MCGNNIFLSTLRFPGHNKTEFTSKIKSKFFNPNLGELFRGSF